MLDTRSLLLALALAVSLPAAAQGDTVLVSNSLASVTKAEYEAELLKLPADMREGFSNNPRRVNELLVRMLVQKSLAAQARAHKLDVKPENATRLALEVDRFLAALEVESIEKAAAAEFDANIQKYETRARETYLVDKASFTTPPQVSATHILFSTKTRSPEEARKLAVAARAEILAGADMTKLARERSDDPSAANNGGALGFFNEKEMDPAFGAAAFALAKPGDVSEPVQSVFGWHVIRLDDRKPSTLQPYEQAREVILGQLRKRHIDEKREAAIGVVRRDPKTQVNYEAVTALIPKVDAATIRRAIEAANATAAQPK